MVGPIAKNIRTSTIARKLAETMNICAQRKNGASHKRGIATELPIVLMGKTKSFATVP